MQEKNLERLGLATKPNKHGTEKHRQQQLSEKEDLATNTRENKILVECIKIIKNFFLDFRNVKRQNGNSTFYIKLK